MQIRVADITPLGRRFMVKPYRRPEKTAGGIIIPDTIRDHQTWSYYEFLGGPKCTCSTKGVDECGWHGKLGIGIDPESIHYEAIFKTRHKVPVQALGVESENGEEIMFLNSEDIEQVILWKR